MSHHLLMMRMILRCCGLLILAATGTTVLAQEPKSTQDLEEEGRIFENSDWIEQRLEERGFPRIPMWSTLGDYQGKPSPEVFRGQITMRPFELGKHIRLYVGGAFGHRNIQLRLHDLNSDAVLMLRPRHKIEGVGYLQWTLPPDWQGRTAYLVASDENPAQDLWIGISLPGHEVPPVMRFHSFKLLCSTLLNLVAPLLILLIIGLAGYVALVRQWEAVRKYFIPLVLGFPLTVAYLQYYIALESIFTSVLISQVTVAGAFAFLLFAGLRRRDFPMETVRYFLPIACLTLFGVIMVNALLYLNASAHNPVRLAQERFLYEVLPVDNYLPLLSLERLWNQESLKPYILEWRSTDRPPLQTAVCLLLRPYMADSIMGYHIVSSWLHASILIGAGFLLHAMGITRRSALWICALVLFSGTFVMNTAFVWPKLFAALFPLLLTGMLIREKGLNRSFAFWLIAGSICALSLLVHQGSLFALVAILSIDTLRHRRLCWQQFAAAGVVGVFWMLPWMLYQKTYDPPGDYNQKRFFANYPYFDDVRFPEALRNAYSSLTLESWTSGRWQNIKTTIGNIPLAFSSFGEQLLQESVHLRLYIFTFIGVSLVPLIAAYVLAWFVRRSRPPDLRRKLWYLHAIIAVGLGLWIVLILPAGRTIISHGSYYFPVLIMLLCGILVHDHKRLLQGLLLLQFVFFALVWAIPGMHSLRIEDRLYNVEFTDMGSLLTVLASIVGIAWLLIRTQDRSSPCERDAAPNNPANPVQ
ncbi:MAG: hypothetical protein ABQ298_01285 [Puniceicoccaceae bacterium]